MVISVTILLISLFLPYRISLETQEIDTGFWLWANRIVDFIFFIDILITFNSAQYDFEFNIIEERKEIAKIYLQSWFFIDLLSIIPFEIFMD